MSVCRDIGFSTRFLEVKFPMVMVPNDGDGAEWWRWQPLLRCSSCKTRDWLCSRDSKYIPDALKRCEKCVNWQQVALVLMVLHSVGLVHIYIYPGYVVQLNTILFDELLNTFACLLTHYFTHLLRRVYMYVYVIN